MCVSKKPLYKASYGMCWIKTNINWPRNYPTSHYKKTSQPIKNKNMFNTYSQQQTTYQYKLRLKTGNHHIAQMK